MADWLIDLLVGHLLIGLLFHLFDYWLIDYLNVNCLVTELMIDWLLDCWLIGYLIVDWLVAWFAQRIFTFVSTTKEGGKNLSMHNFLTVQGHTCPCTKLRKKIIKKIERKRATREEWNFKTLPKVQNISLVLSEWVSEWVMAPCVLVRCICCVMCS